MHERSSILTIMNQLPIERRTAVVRALIEGNSLRAVSRMTGTHRTAIQKLLAELGRACSVFQDRTFRNLSCKRIQCDEIWAFVGSKEKNTSEEKKAEGWGDCWTWIAMDADTKLIPCWYVGTRDARAAYHFMHDLADRIAHRVQLTTDGHRPYLAAVQDAFGDNVDYAQLVKIYGDGPKTEARYSPAQCMGARKAVISGTPNRDHVSTSHIERQNLTLRMSNRRFTRLTNAFSKKVENHEHSVALHFMQYNFCRIHRTLRVTPAMEAGVADHVWSIEEVIALLDSEMQVAA
jgi:IS1 family transposase